MGIRPGTYSGAGEFTITWSVDRAGITNLNQKVTGWFRSGSFYAALEEVNEGIAWEMQEKMLQTLQRRIKETGRYQRSTMYLVDAVADRKFREVYPGNFAVGKESFLNESEAGPYWRRIEVGYASTISGRILFANELPSGPFYRPWSPDGYTYERVGGRERKRTRSQPPGYKHAFMPMGRGVEVYGIGPWPAYRYLQSGLATFQRANMFRRYKTALAKIGMNMTDVGPGKPPS